MRFPEEIELAQKRIELTELLEQQSRVERDLSAIKGVIRAFERTYEHMLGDRIAELEQLEWQISGLLGSDEGEEHQKYYHSTESVSTGHAASATSLLDDDAETTPINEEKSLKALYREVAKMIHPDLAMDDNERYRRQELMSVANLAYEEGDRSTLQRILREWQLGPEIGRGMDIGAELVRIIRQIAHVRQNIIDIKDHILELHESDIYLFKLRVDDAVADGIDLLAEMAATVDLDLAKARKRLALLRGETEAEDERPSPPLATRLVRFPAEFSCGLLYLRGINSVDYRDWQYLGNARGAREIPLDTALRLDLRGDLAQQAEFLQELSPDNLQALFLYEVDDNALSRLGHLEGLQELYLSNTTVTDNALKYLTCLTGLHRLYIYHTDITDAGLPNLYTMKWLRWLTLSGTKVTEEGLKELRQALPECKVITFKWRYD